MLKKLYDFSTRIMMDSTMMPNEHVFAGTNMKDIEDLENFIKDSDEFKNIQMDLFMSTLVNSANALKKIPKRLRTDEGVFNKYSNMVSAVGALEILKMKCIAQQTEEMSFEEILPHIKNGCKAARLGWNGKNMFVVLQKGYPEGIPCNEQTAMAWGLQPGDLFKCNPYMQIKNADGSHSMWVPSIGDILAADWIIIK